jgi:hypothetical protein
MRKTSLKQSKPLRVKATLKPKKSIQAAKPKGVAKLKKEADKWYSLALRLRFADKNGLVKCFTCPNIRPVKQIQCGHFMSRSHNATRYVEENTAPQCYGCNVMHQGMQYKFGLELDLFYGDGTAQRMFEQSRQTHPFKPEELLKIIEDSKAATLDMPRTGQVGLS